jgi:iron uptake system component EfeO
MLLAPEEPMRARRSVRLLAVVTLAFAVTLGACAKDDGADTRCGGSGSSGAGSSAAGSASAGSASSGGADCDTTTTEGASGSASGSALSEDEVAGTSDNPLVNDAVAEYQDYVEEQVSGLVTDTKVFTDAVRAGDIEAAKAAYAPSRVRWERIEPIAALIESIDGAVDARAEEGVADTESPEVTGWHQLEYDLWVAEDIADDKELADELDANIAKLQEGLPDLEITPLAVAKGAQELIEEVADGKITGEEDRYSHTDLSDLNANVEGAKAATDLLMPAIEEADKALAAELKEAFEDANAVLAPYRDGDGWKPFDEVSDADRTTLKAKFSALAEELGEVPGVLELG